MLVIHVYICIYIYTYGCVYNIYTLTPRIFISLCCLYHVPCPFSVVSSVLYPGFCNDNKRVRRFDVRNEQKTASSHAFCHLSCSAIIIGLSGVRGSERPVTSWIEHRMSCERKNQYILRIQSNIVPIFSHTYLMNYVCLCMCVCLFVGEWEVCVCAGYTYWTFFMYYFDDLSVRVVHWHAVRPLFCPRKMTNGI